MRYAKKLVRKRDLIIDIMHSIFNALIYYILHISLYSFTIQLNITLIKTVIHLSYKKHIL